MYEAVAGLGSPKSAHHGSGDPFFDDRLSLSLGEAFGTKFSLSQHPLARSPAPKSTGLCREERSLREHDANGAADSRAALAAFPLPDSTTLVTALNRVLQLPTLARSARCCGGILVQTYYKHIMAAWLDLVAAADKNGFYLFKMRAIDLYALVKAASALTLRQSAPLRY